VLRSHLICVVLAAGWPGANVGWLPADDAAQQVPPSLLEVVVAELPTFGIHLPKALQSKAVFHLSLHFDRLPGQFCRLLGRLTGHYIEHWSKVPKK
jgi:hypothetical protein